MRNVEAISRPKRRLAICSLVLAVATSLLWPLSHELGVGWGVSHYRSTPTLRSDDEHCVLSISYGELFVAFARMQEPGPWSNPATSRWSTSLPEIDNPNDLSAAYWHAVLEHDGFWWRGFGLICDRGLAATVGPFYLGPTVTIVRMVGISVPIWLISVLFWVRVIWVWTRYRWQTVGFEVVRVKA